MCASAFEGVCMCVCACAGYVHVEVCQVFDSRDGINGLHSTVCVSVFLVCFRDTCAVDAFVS